jgi:hypothetical protein
VNGRRYFAEQLIVALATVGAGLILIGLRLSRSGINAAERVVAAAGPR